jgi:hypothetical protein
MATSNTSTPSDTRVLVPSRGWASHLSLSSWVILGAGVTAALGVYSVQILLANSGNAVAATAFSDVGETVVIGWAAAMIFVLAMRLHASDVLRDQWVMLAAAAAAFFAGDAVWTVYEVVLVMKPPYPGWADAGYILGYLLFGLAVLYAAITYAHGVNLRLPTLLSVALGVVASAALIPLAVTPITGSGAPIASQAMSLAYIFGDVWLRMVPALLIVLVIQRTGRSKIALAWLTVALAAALLGVADALFGVLEARGLYTTGSPADLAFMIGYVLLVVAASMAVDAHSGDDLLDQVGLDT